MLIGVIVAAVTVAALTVALLTRRIAHDDVHSVEGYHRSIHTLESMNAHPVASEPGPGSGPGPGLGAKPGYPSGALRVVGTPSVRVTDTSGAVVPPVRPPAVTHPDVPLTFDDAGPPARSPSSEPVGHRDKAVDTMNHRPRRLAAPATAVAVVIVLVIVLLVTGSHSVAPPPRHQVRSGGRDSNSPGGHPGRNTTATTTATTSPHVVVPESGTAGGATYDVPGSNFTLAFSATSGACWVDATNSTSGVTLFAGTVQPGAQRSFGASGPVTVILGAPTSLAVLVNGNPVALPAGFLTPFTMKFVTAS